MIAMLDVLPFWSGASEGLGDENGGFDIAAFEPQGTFGAQQIGANMYV